MLKIIIIKLIITFYAFLNIYSKKKQRYKIYNLQMTLPNNYYVNTVYIGYYIS
jgi:hypothetical protein